VIRGLFELWRERELRAIIPLLYVFNETCSVAAVVVVAVVVVVGGVTVVCFYQLKINFFESTIYQTKYLNEHLLCFTCVFYCFA